MCISLIARCERGESIVRTCRRRKSYTAERRWRVEEEGPYLRLPEAQALSRDACLQMRELAAPRVQF